MKYFARARRGDDGAVVRALRFVHDHEREILRFIRREESDERGHVFPRGDPAVFVFLRRSCLAIRLWGVVLNPLKIKEVCSRSFV